MNHEFDAISRLFQQRVSFTHHSTTVGNGDDASVHHIPDGFEMVISTDTAVETIHWPIDMPLNIAGNRAVNAALSDLAAMGAEPAWIWLAVMAKDEQSLSHMSNGLVEACLSHHIELAGGDTTRSATNAMNVSVGGLVPQGSAMSRNHANEADEIWVMGDLGLSAAGLNQWQNGEQQGDFVANFKHISPLYKQGIKLRELGVSCCIDISDGLLQDAGHICRASQIGMDIEITHVKALKNYLQLAPNFDEEESLKLILNGGEDYALLCTAPVELHESLTTLGAKYLGQCVKGNTVKLCHQGKSIDYNIKGYDHFA